MAAGESLFEVECSGEMLLGWYSCLASKKVGLLAVNKQVKGVQGLLAWSLELAFHMLSNEIMHWTVLCSVLNRVKSTLLTSKCSAKLRASTRCEGCLRHHVQLSRQVQGPAGLVTCCLSRSQLQERDDEAAWGAQMQWLS